MCFRQSRSWSPASGAPSCRSDCSRNSPHSPVRQPLPGQSTHCFLSRGFPCGSATTGRVASARFRCVHQEQPSLSRQVCAQVAQISCQLGHAHIKQHRQRWLHRSSVPDRVSAAPAPATTALRTSRGTRVKPRNQHFHPTDRCSSVACQRPNCPKTPAHPPSHDGQRQTVNAAGAPATDGRHPNVLGRPGCILEPSPHRGLVDRAACNNSGRAATRKTSGKDCYLR